MVKSACNAGDRGLIPGSGRFPWRRKGQPIPLFLPGKAYGWRSLAGCSPYYSMYFHVCILFLLNILNTHGYFIVFTLSFRDLKLLQVSSAECCFSLLVLSALFGCVSPFLVSSLRSFLSSCLPHSLRPT